MRSLCSFLVLFGVALLTNGCHVYFPGAGVSSSYSRCVDPSGCASCGTGIYGAYDNTLTRSRARRLERLRENSFLRSGDPVARNRAMRSAIAGYDVDGDLYEYDLYGTDDYGFGDQLADGWMPMDSYAGQLSASMTGDTGCPCNNGAGATAMPQTVQHGGSDWTVSDYINDGWQVVEEGSTPEATSENSPAPMPSYSPMPMGAPMPMPPTDGDAKEVPVPTPSTDAYYTPRQMPTLAPIPDVNASRSPVQPVLWVPAGL
ncbi:MAG: hypothetical protein R3C01_04915 [Planctomycetaceae bacterium]